jgi:hypothetical protein
MDQFDGYVDSIRLQSADKLIVNKPDNGHVIVIESEIRGRSSRRVRSMKIGCARSSNFESARSRIGEIIWTRMRRGTP